MKDFIKWLGVNEKIAKVAVWMLIFMVTLIIINAALASLGFLNYQITYDNLKNVNLGKYADLISRLLVCILNFYAILLMIFRLNKAKDLFKWGIMYLILNALIYQIGGYLITQIFIFTFFIVFSYLYSKKKPKYLLYAVISIIVNIAIEGLTYYYKASFINIAEVSRVTRALLFSDYFIIMAVIILVKEIYLKKRGEKNGKFTMDRRIQK